MEEIPLIDISVTGCEEKIHEALANWGGISKENKANYHGVTTKLSFKGRRLFDLSCSDVMLPSKYCFDSNFITQIILCVFFCLKYYSTYLFFAPIKGLCPDQKES